MTREEAFDEINKTQEYYVNELITAINSKDYESLKEINFTSDTGTGKTKMMAMLCNKLPKYYFVITTLSRGQLMNQIRINLGKEIHQSNYIVYGSNDFTENTKLQAKDIIAKLPKDKSVIWLRDEGHINTNRWQEVLNERSWKIINFSATNKEEGIRCNFTHTMMLRTVNQSEGTIENALDKLIQVKKEHQAVKKYNPCAIIRSLSKETTDATIKACEERKLRYINITDEKFDMFDLCQDDNEYDVIINKFKIVEGIDIRRAHVLYMTNEPSNVGTTIQIIGRCRRNALLYRNDIDIFAKKNQKLLLNTRQCYVFYNVKNMNIDSDDAGNLYMAFCNIISCEKLKIGSRIHVEDGTMENGLSVIELEGLTGDFEIKKDKNTGFNVVNKIENGFYRKKIVNQEKEKYVYVDKARKLKKFHLVVHEYEVYKIDDIIKKLTLEEQYYENFDIKLLGIGYNLYERKDDVVIKIPPKVVEGFIDYISDYKREVIINKNGKNEYKIEFTISQKPKTEFDLLNGDEIINSNDEGVYEQLKKLLYSDYLKKDIFTCKKKDLVNTFCDEIIKQNQYILPCGMERGKPFYIRYKNRYKITGKKISDIPNAKYKKITSHILLESQIAPLFLYYDYEVTVNDKESAIIGTDMMKCIDNKWYEDKTVTSKIRTFCKFNTFIQKRYAIQIENIKSELFNGKNHFEFDKKCNSCLGYCAEFYAKYLVYGEYYMKNYIEQAEKECKEEKNSDAIIIRACMLKYVELMQEAFGINVKTKIPTMSIEKLIEKDKKEFVKQVILLGTNIADFVRKELNIVKPLEKGDKIHDPNLSIEHLAGLADFINEEKIIDVKCTSSITIEHVKQVLAYHYLSTKRSDLHIKEVIVFDAVTRKFVRIEI